MSPGLIYFPRETAGDLVPQLHPQNLLRVLRGELLQHLQQRGIGRHRLVALLLHINRLHPGHPGWVQLTSSMAVKPKKNGAF